MRNSTFLRKFGQQNLLERASYHKSYPDITFEQYRLIKRKELNDTIEPLKKIYLDLNYWIQLRNSISSSEKRRPFYREIFEVLKGKVIAGQVVCPFSTVLFDEMLKQQDMKSRRRTTQIADILSGGFSIAPLYYIIGCEVSNLIAKTKGRALKQHYYTWVKPISVFGDFNLKTKAELTSEELLLKKLVYDGMLLQSFQEVTAFNDNYIKDQNSAEWHANMMNQSKKYNQLKEVSFTTLHRMELQSTYESAARSMRLEQMDFKALIRSYSLEQLRLLTPVTYVYTSIYVNLQLDKQRIIKPNDYYDISHSAIALGTCDYFITERSFCSMLKSMKLHEKFGKTIASNPREVLDILESI